MENIAAILRQSNPLEPFYWRSVVFLLTKLNAKCIESAWKFFRIVSFLCGCVQFGNLDLDFKIRILDLQSNAKSKIRKRISTLRYLFLDFHFHRSIGKSEKGFEKLSLRTAVLHAHAYLAKRRPCFTRIVLQILFWISQSHGKRKSMKSGFGFLNWNPPWGRISRRWNPFSDFAFDCKTRNPDFPIERNLYAPTKQSNIFAQHHGSF